MRERSAYEVSRPRFVIDTNVVVSGVLTSRPTAPTRRIVDGMLRGRFPYLLSQDLLAEYRQVLLRPKIVERHRLSQDQIDILLTEIVANAVMRSPAEFAEGAPDPGDDHLWALVGCTPGDAPYATLVTGDGKLLSNPPELGSVISPSDFSKQLSQEGS